MLFEALKHERPWTLEGYRSFGGYEAWEKILREQDAAREDHRRGQGLGAARAGRRRVSDRREMELHAALLAGAEVRGVQLGRVRARHLP